MSYLLNLVYLLLLIVLTPWLVFRRLTGGKYPRGLWHKLTGRAVLRTGAAPCAWFHGVSVGEIHLLRQVVAAFRKRHPGWECVISTTTETGLAEAKRCFADLAVFYWPFDFTWAVKRALRRVRPNLIVLAEGELWPNFLAAANRRRVPVAVVNGRMSPRSFRRYRRLGVLSRRLFNRLDLCVAQTDEYAVHFQALGVAAGKVHVTGSVKYDGACADRDNPRTCALRRLLAVEEGDLVWIAGSTQAPEEQIVLDIYRRARKRHRNLRLFVVPRQKDRFDEVAELLRRSGLPFVRRSALTESIHDRRAIVLIDSIGELGALWGLADVAFVGGSLDGQRGGQNMIEPAAYGAAVVFGPHVWNFKDAVERLLAAKAAIQVMDAAALEAAVNRLFEDIAERQRIGTAARWLALEQQGATERTIALLQLLMPRTTDGSDTAPHRLAG
ncbi:MAG TPA: 3-deoxy-D-manno-octulosonic acid transferase [Gemmataceae bacterium]|nr:3-deoxy-D-manno-octulosonic acid transferase [Gemmataceae bacterium]